MSDATTTTDAPAPEANQEQTFSQGDVDRIVKDRLAQQAKNKFGDYDALKSAAAEKATADDRIAALEKQITDANAKALRSDVATKYGITAEDRDLFLTGSDPDALEQQAKRLADRDSEVKKQGNRAPREGDTKNNGGEDKETRKYVRDLFNTSD